MTQMGTSLQIGYARCSTEKQDLEAQRVFLGELGVSPERIYTDFGLTGTNRDRDGLKQALAACREGDVLIVTKLDRLARSVPDACSIFREVSAKGARLQIGGMVHDLNDPMGKLFLNLLAMIAEFEGDLIRMRTREGMAIARSKGRLRGKQPKLTPKQESHLVTLHAAGEHTGSELAELFGVARSTVYRALERSQASPGTLPVGVPGRSTRADRRSPAPHA